MLDILVAAGQFLSVMGLVYGVVLTLMHRDCVDALRSEHDPRSGHDRLGARFGPVSIPPRRRPLRRPAAARSASRAGFGR